MSEKKLNIALVGLRFGAEFAPLYHAHPDVASLRVFDTDAEKCKALVDAGFADSAYASFEDLLNDPTCDAVHLVTPIPLHAEQTIAVLNAGKHCACTVPMATSIEDLYRIAEARRRSGKIYMMMETTLYTYQFLYARQMLAQGEFGRIQFLRGSHYQDLRGWPSYWEGFPPMWYGTHAIAPMTVLADSRIKQVSCLGSGVTDEEFTARYGNPYPMETAHFLFENGLAAEATRSLFDCVRLYQEGMFIYGSKGCFEWGYADWDPPYITRTVQENGQTRVDARITEMPNPYHTLPESLWKYTVGQQYDPENPIASLTIGSGAPHHGSHPHLVHEFVRSVIEEREPAISLPLAANVTAAGLCAHESAMHGGAFVTVPDIR